LQGERRVRRGERAEAAGGCAPRRSRRDGSLLMRVCRVVGPAVAAHRRRAETRLVAKAGKGSTPRRGAGGMARASARATGEPERGELAAEATAVGSTPGHHR
jgi:hypothetical protein